MSEHWPEGIRKRVSFCLYGSDPVYCEGALANLESLPARYPGWEPVFYTKDIPDDLLEKLSTTGATIVECDYRNMTLARFLPCCEEGVVLSRDCDSRIYQREVRAVGEWLASGKPRHVIRDHPGHIPGWAMIPAGLFASRKPFPERVRDSLLVALNSEEYSAWGGDQRWLVDQVWEPDKFLIHQSHCTTKIEGVTR